VRGIRRAKGVAPNGKSPILTPLLRQMAAALPDDLPGFRDKALLLIGFAGAFRRSEIVGLQVRDVQIGDAGLIVTLWRSKTDQEGVSFTRGTLGAIVLSTGAACGAALDKEMSVRKIVVAEFASLDGVIQAPEGRVLAISK
jgi:hypothetical protein